MMNARVDYAIMPPGLIRGAMCYSLVMDNESLYLIRVSRGWKVGYAPRGVLEGSVANFVVARMLKKAAAATQDLTSANYQEMAGGKGSQVIPLSQVSGVEFKERAAELRFKGGAKKFKFRFESSEVASFGVFAITLQARVQG
jgi:hypothetical protein